MVSPQPAQEVVHTPSGFIVNHVDMLQDPLGINEPAY